MYLKSCAIFVASVLDLAIASAVPATHVVHEQRNVLSQRWVKKNRVQHDAVLLVKIGLAQSNLENAHDYLMDVSDPTSNNYGKHWTPEQVVETFKPSDESVQSVRQWLVNGGIPAETITTSDNKAWFAFHAPSTKMESLLHTQYHEFEDQHTGEVVPACDEYHVPSHIQKHVDYITPGIRLLAPLSPAPDQSLKRHVFADEPRSLSRRPSFKAWKGEIAQLTGSNRNNLSNCDNVITPACLAALYKFPPAHLAHPNNTLGIYESEVQFWDQVDLNLYFANFTPQIPQGTHPIEYNIDGAVQKTENVSLAGGEAMLDLELAYSIIYPQKIAVFDQDDLNNQRKVLETFTQGSNNFLDAIDGSYCTYSAYGETGNLAGLDATYPDPSPGGYKGRLQCGVYKPTNVFSISYSGQEADVPIAYQRRQCNEFLKLGLQGHSFFFASGDSGVGLFPAPYGYDGPTGCLGPKHNVFNPTWPNTCPYVTNVGATKVYPGHTVYQPESAVFDVHIGGLPVNYSSGGGFSNIFPVPSYQKTAVNTYFQQHDPKLPYYSKLATDHPQSIYSHLNVTALQGNTRGIYNRIGRGVPDVAANGDNIPIFNRGAFRLSYGTSAATPIFASIVNLINEERLAIGKGPVGFVNPVLYAHPEVLNDITNGTNAACFGPGFNAVKGWDPVTGLGTPNYPKMLKLFLSLP